MAALAAALVLGGCALPKDPEGTLERVRDGTVRVGVVHHEPWALPTGSSAKGVEPELVRRLAGDLRARIVWVSGSESQLVAALHERELDLVVGGLTTGTPWKKEVALTQPYLRTSVVVGLPPAAAAGPELAALEVVAEQGSEALGLAEDATDARVLAVTELSAARGRPAAVADYLLDDLGLERAKTLKQERHVFAVAPGENAWLMRVNRFLIRHGAAARHLLEREARP